MKKSCHICSKELNVKYILDSIRVQHCWRPHFNNKDHAMHFKNEDFFTCIPCGKQLAVWNHTTNKKKLKMLNHINLIQSVIGRMMILLMNGLLFMTIDYSLFFFLVCLDIHINQINNATLHNNHLNNHLTEQGYLVVARINATPEQPAHVHSHFLHVYRL